MLHMPYHLVIVDTGEKMRRFFHNRIVDETILARFFPRPMVDLAFLILTYKIYVAWMTNAPTWKSSPSSDQVPGSSSDQVQNVQGHTGHVAPSRQLPMDSEQAETKTLGPWDSASWQARSEVSDEGDVSVAEPSTDDDNKWEDEELSAGIKRWADDVRRATDDTGPCCLDDPGHN